MLITPYVGCDSFSAFLVGTLLDFYSHTSHGVRLLHLLYHSPTLYISTHTSHAGCDQEIIVLSFFYVYFYSRTPCGVRQTSSKRSIYFLKFLLTHPMWGATIISFASSEALTISTHAPHVGCDRYDRQGRLTADNFYSRTPCGVRHNQIDYQGTAETFLLTHPMWGATR